MKRLSALCMVLAFVFFSSGCFDKRELENNNFAILLGIDMAQNGGVVITVAFALTQAGGGGQEEGADKGGGDYTVMSAKAPTLVEGVSLFSSKLSGPLALHTVKAIVVSEELARSDMLRQVFSYWRYKEIRNTANVIISKCTAAEFIKARVENAPIDPLRQEELLLEQANTSAYSKPMQLFELLANLKSDSGDAVAMYGGISAQGGGEDTSEEENPGGEDIEATVKDGYLPGEVPVSAQSKTEISGLAVFHGAKMVGVLDSMQTQAFSMLTRSKTKKIITLPDPFYPQFDIVMEILPTGKRRISGRLEEGIAQIYISVTIKCTVACIQSPVDYSADDNYAALTEHVRSVCAESMAELIAKAQKEYNADILKLGDKIARRFATLSLWEEYGWPEKYKDAQIALNVNVDIERTGIMMP